MLSLLNNLFSEPFLTCVCTNEPAFLVLFRADADPCNDPNPFFFASAPTVMQSQGSTSTLPSFDSLSSGDGLLLSDSEQAEDDSDVFLAGSSSSVVVSGTGGAEAKKDEGSKSPGARRNGVTDKEEEAYRSKGDNSHLGLEETGPVSQKPKSQGDLLFAQKVKKVMY